MSWFITGIVASGNLDIPILLASSNNQTVPLLAYNQFNNGSLAQAAATFCLLIGIVAAVLVPGPRPGSYCGIRKRTSRPIGADPDPLIGQTAPALKSAAAYGEEILDVSG